MKIDTVSIIIIVACVIMSAYFSATETAFSTLNRIRIKNMAENGDKRAKLVMKLYNNYDKLLTSILIGNNIVNVLMSALATVLFVALLGSSGTVVSTAVITIIVLIFGEITPKTLAKEYPEKFAMFSAPIIRAVAVVLTPFNYIFSLWKKLLFRLFHKEEDDSITEEEFLTIVDEAEQEGGIDEQESELIRNVIAFNEMEAIDILTPRVDVVGIPVATSKEKIATLFARTGYSRLPVYEGSLDNIVGIIHQKDFHNQVYHTDRPLTDIIHSPVYISQSMNVGALLSKLQKTNSHFAVVTDEYGGTMGIVTMEDILEELVGEIWDEHDKVVEEIQKIGENQYKVLGSANFDKLMEILDMDAEADASSVGGWVMEQLKDIPEAGASFTYDRLSVMVNKVEHQRIIDLIVTVSEPEEADDEDDDD